MKKSSGSGFLLIIIVLVLVVILTIHLFVRKSFTPYNPSTIFSNQAKFEGFHQMNRHLNYGTYPGNTAIDQAVNYDIAASKRPFQPVFGLGGLFGPPNTPDNNLDIYSSANGNLSENCHNMSSGLSNSMGYLCMTPTQIQMLTTRGGNQTCCQSTIGSN